MSISRRLTTAATLFEGRQSCQFLDLRSVKSVESIAKQDSAQSSISLSKGLLSKCEQQLRLSLQEDRSYG